MKKYTFRNYNEYIKDNPKKLWFKMRLYGWGWVPATWQGWIIILAFIAILLFNGFYFSYKVTANANPTIQDFTLFFGTMIISIIILFWICLKKGETPKWSWGRN